MSKIEPMMQVVEPLRYLTSSRINWKSHTSIKNFLFTFLGRLEKLLNIHLFIGVESNLGENTEAINKLNHLSSLNIVKSVFKIKRGFEDEPHIKAVSVELIGHKSRGYSGYGRSLYDHDEAWGPAYGEALERWCLENFDPAPEATRILSTQQLRNLTLPIDLQSLPRMDENASKPVGSRINYTLTEDSRFNCVYVDELVNNEKTFAPLQWFSFKHVRRAVHKRQEPQIQPIISTGAAVGLTLEDARLSGIYECLERDAFSIYWLRQITPRRLSLGLAEPRDAEKISSLIERYSLECHFLYLKTDFPIHTVLCMVLDKSGVGPSVVVDASTGVDIASCIQKSFLGAVGQREYMRHSWPKYSDRVLNVDLLTIETRNFWWYKTDSLKNLDFLLKGLMVEDVPNYSYQSKTEELYKILESLNSKGYRVYCADILNPEFSRNIKEKAVFIKIPRLVPMHLNEWEKTMRGDRLFEVPKYLGRPVLLEDINQVPHPFS